MIEYAESWSERTFKRYAILAFIIVVMITASVILIMTTRSAFHGFFSLAAIHRKRTSLYHHQPVVRDARILYGMGWARPRRDNSGKGYLWPVNLTLTSAPSAVPVTRNGVGDAMAAGRGIHSARKRCRRPRPRGWAKAGAARSSSSVLMDRENYRRAALPRSPSLTVRAVVAWFPVQPAWSAATRALASRRF